MISLKTNSTMPMPVGEANCPTVYLTIPGKEAVLPKCGSICFTFSTRSVTEDVESGTRSYCLCLDAIEEVEACSEEAGVKGEDALDRLLAEVLASRKPAEDDGEED
jgi:hypothetical protein